MLGQRFHLLLGLAFLFFAFLVPRLNSSRAQRGGLECVFDAFANSPLRLLRERRSKSGDLQASLLERRRGELKKRE